MSDAGEIQRQEYQIAKQEYFQAVNAYCAGKLRDFKDLDTLVYHYLIDTERVSADQDKTQAMRETELNQSDTLELTDYLFRHLANESGSLEQRFLTELAPTLSAAARRLAEARQTAFPSLWQIVEVNEPNDIVIKNVMDDRVGRMVLDPGEKELQRPFALLFGELVEIANEIWAPVGVIYVGQPGDRGWLRDAIRRSYEQARAAGLVKNWEEFGHWYDPAIRGAIRVFNGLRPPKSSATYLPALGRADLGPRMAEVLAVPFKSVSNNRLPDWGIQFGGARASNAGVETIHRYFLKDPGLWAKTISETANMQLYRIGEEFGWWYYGEGTAFDSESLGTEASAHPILADISFDPNGQMIIRVFTPRVFKTLEPVLRELAPKGQVLPKPVTQVEPLGERLPIYQVHPECRGYVVLAPNLGRRMTPEEMVTLDEEWLIQMILQTRYRWSGGRTLEELVELEQLGAVEDFLNQLAYLSRTTNDYGHVLTTLRARLLS